MVETHQFSVLWPAGPQLTPKVRALVDFLGENLFREAMPDSSRDVSFDQETRVIDDLLRLQFMF